VPIGRGAQNFRKDDEGHGAIRAIDPKTGDRKWEFKMNDVTDAGILTTSTDLLFSGGREGYFFALDARNGDMLWKSSVGGVVASGPMTYSVGGRQYIAVAAGNSLFTFALRQ
jgi:alcohol dehydrogenase (cytochrome c)